MDQKTKVIQELDKLKEKYPDTKFIVETKKGTISFKIKDALIYEGMRGEIVLDSE